MNTLKNIFFALLIVAISSAVFLFVVLYDQNKNENDLDTMLQEFGNGILAMVPSGEQRDALAQKWENFKTLVLNQQVSENQLKTTLARGANMQLAEEKPSVQEIQAFIERSAEPAKPERPERDKSRHSRLSEREQERLANQMREFLTIKHELKNFEDPSLARVFSQHVMVTADSDLQILFDSNIHNNQVFVTNPHAKAFIENLPKADFVKFVKFDDSPELVEQALQDYAPFLPQNVRAPLIFNISNGANVAVLLDSMNKQIQNNMFDSDSIQVIFKNVQKIMESLEQSQ